jgi:hypothetical protein
MNDINHRHSAPDAPSSDRALNAQQRRSPSKTTFIVILASFCIFQLGRLSSSNLNQFPSPDNISRYAPFLDTSTHEDDYEDTPLFKLHTHCTADDTSKNKYNTTISEMAQLFQIKKNSWELTRNKGSTSADDALTLQFQIIECPQRYAASSFHVQARTHQTVFAGSVGPRFKVEEGCGYYNATIPIVPTSGYYNANNESKSDGMTCGEDNPTAITYPQKHAFYTIEAFWTTEYRNYANRLEDKNDAWKLYEEKEKMTSQQIADLLGHERLHYLTHHLDVLPSFPIILELVNRHDIAALKEDTEDLLKQPHRDMSSLPNCTDVPIAEWLPVGIRNSVNNIGAVVPTFQSHKCNYLALDRTELNHWFAGMRVKYLGDSHGQFESDYVFQLTCPEAKSSDVFFRDNYSCSMESTNNAGTRKNTFAFAYRFYRAIMHLTGGDHDGLSTNMRQATIEACTKFFGIGLYNATVITTPSWLFVHETKEGLYDYLRSLKNSIQVCRRIYTEKMNNLVLLVQSPIASDVLLTSLEQKTYDWRQNHNFRQEAFTRTMYEELEGVVDGIIPVFEWTLARNWMQGTSDGVHLKGSYYGEIFHVQTMAIISAMKNKGWQVPVMAEDDERVRWFDGVPLE